MRGNKKRGRRKNRKNSQEPARILNQAEIQSGDKVVSRADFSLFSFFFPF
jgi:hypothetical protein